MDLIERYLQQVRFWLPADQGDLAAELAEDLRSQREAAEAGLGRPLTEAETGDLLKRLGSPLQVAGQILPQRPWLNPAQTMLFRFVLRVVLLYVLVPVFGLIAIPAALLSAHPLSGVASALQAFVSAEISALGCVTLVFWAVGRAQAAREAGAGWDPLKLPPLRRPGNLKPVSRAESVAEIVFGLLFVGWWLEAGSGIPVAGSSHLGALAPSGPLWADLRGPWFLPILALALANLSVAALCLARPHLTRLRLAWGALSSAALAGIAGSVLAGPGTPWEARFHLLARLGRGLPEGPTLGIVFDQVLALMLASMVLGGALGALVQGIKFLLALRPNPEAR